MNCIIIEDEENALEHLENELALTGYDLKIQARIDSVEDAVTWLKNNTTDLVFLDIQLSDGLSFEIFDHVTIQTPIIFTTSYDQFAIKAFELNSISYLLKPVYADGLKRSLDKYKQHQDLPQVMNERILPLHQSFQSRFLVRSGKSFISIPVTDIAYFYLQDKRLILITTRDGRQYLYDSTMEILEQRLNPDLFFRINRRFIACYDSITQIDSIDGRLKIDTLPPIKDPILVSINKAAAFKHWLDR